MLTGQTRAGQTITLTYDTLNRLATKAAPSEPSGGEHRAVVPGKGASPVNWEPMNSG